MALKHKFLYSVDPEDYKRSTLQVSLQVIGIFDTSKVLWRYYAISTVKGTNGSLQMTDDISSSFTTCNIDNIRAYGMKFDDIESAKKYIDDFRVKWETGSNNTIQEVRDKKLKELTNE